MRAELITVGTELLLGEVVNSHLEYLSQSLAELGVGLYRQITVGDNLERLKETIVESLLRCRLLIITGGLGPTEDDLTQRAVCEVLDCHVDPHWNIIHPSDLPASGALESERKTFFAKNGFFQNDNGTAPGVVMHKGSWTLLLLPGPPSELRPMFAEQVRPYLECWTGQTIRSHNIHLYGMDEASVEQRASDWMKSSNPTLAVYAKAGEVRLRVTAKGNSLEECEEMLQPRLQQLCEKLGEAVYGVDLAGMEEAVVRKALQCGKTIAVAESCTGGMLAQRLTSVPGASDCFLLGTTVYSNSSKERVLGVSPACLQSKGAVSEETACQMAQGVRALAGSDLALSITGIAGPGGGTKEKPVGLVYIGVASSDGVEAFSYHFARGVENERESIRNLTTLQALFLLLNMLK